MEQHLRDEVELGERARRELDQENAHRPEVRELYVRMRVRNAQNAADISRTFDRQAAGA